MTEPVDLARLLPQQTFVSSSRIRSTVRAEIRAHDAQLVEAVGGALGVAMREAEQRCAALQAEINGLRSAMSEFRFVGQWVEGKQYRRGNFVAMGGVWHCDLDTVSKPGTSGDWSLAMPRGRDGRDAPAPAETPEARTTRTAPRSSLDPVRRR